MIISGDVLLSQGIPPLINNISLLLEMANNLISCGVGGHSPTRVGLGAGGIPNSCVWDWVAVGGN